MYCQMESGSTAALGEEEKWAVERFKGQMQMSKAEGQFSKQK